MMDAAAKHEGKSIEVIYTAMIDAASNEALN
jgi:hypothetical protein